LPLHLLKKRGAFLQKTHNFTATKPSTKLRMTHITGSLETGWQQMGVF